MDDDVWIATVLNGITEQSKDHYAKLIPHAYNLLYLDRQILIQRWPETDARIAKFLVSRTRRELNGITAKGGPPCKSISLTNWAGPHVGVMARNDTPSLRRGSRSPELRPLRLTAATGFRRLYAGDAVPPAPELPAKSNRSCQ
ncbi:Os04g0445350 [Oryza sativa Japonica Group]|jgi:hypothetical protein|uniref:Os04g0445350 protein n=1 Tax=Oryza sativa subsp. japonica TaxID=39947 RepID=A0A0P0WB46_ORYSJ|nr:Os04g0445350 [Oryza sativa Japonica Group]